MSDEPHAVVRLLLARIQSHPEEFKRGTARWVSITNQVEDWGSEADKQTINDALRDVRLTEAHEEMMEELLNGEDRRRKEEEDRQYEMGLSYKAVSSLQQHQSAVTQALNQYPTQTTPFRFPLGGLL